MDDRAQSLQERYAPNNICFGCGPKNEKGLRIRSFPVENAPDSPDAVECEWQPEAHHEAFPGMLNGGIIGALFDCHMNWCATHHLMRKGGLESPPSTVTAEFSVVMKRPTPTAAPVRVTARVDRCVVRVRADCAFSRSRCAVASAFSRALFSEGFSKCPRSFISRKTPSRCSFFLSAFRA